MIFLEKIAKNYFLVLPIIVAVVYLRLLSFGMTGFGDDLILVNNFERITNFTDIISEFSKSYPDGNDYKPITMISYYVNALFAGQSTLFCHLTNMVLHALICILIYRFMLLLELSRVSSIIGSIIFAIHPIISGNVALIASRNYLLMVTFGLLSMMYCIYYFREHNSQKIWLSGLFLLLSILSDFSGFSFAMLIVAYALTFHKNDFKENFNIIIAPILSVVIIWFLLFMNVDIQNAPPQPQSNSNIISIGGIFINPQMIYLLPEIVGKFLLPVNISTLPFFNTLSMILGSVAIIIMAVLPFIFFRSNELMKKVVPFGLYMLIIGTIFSSLSLTNASSSIYDYLSGSIYFPTIGLIIILSGMISIFPENLFGRYFNIVLVIIIGLLSYIGFFNLKSYESELVFIETAYDKNPDNLTLASKLIDTYSAGGYDDKINLLSKKIDISKPNNSEIILKISQFYYKRKDYDSAINYLEKLRKIDDQNKPVIQLLVSAYHSKNDFGNASKVLEAVAMDTTKFPEARWDLFNMYLENKQFDEAQTFAKTTFISETDIKRALLMTESWSKIFFKEKDNVAVVKTMKVALEIQPDNPVVLNYLYDTYMKIGLKEKAHQYEIRLKKIFNEQIKEK